MYYNNEVIFFNLIFSQLFLNYFSFFNTLNMPRAFSKCMRNYASGAVRDNRKSTVSQSQSIGLRFRFSWSSRIPRSTNAFANAPLCVDFCDEQIYDSYQIQLPSTNTHLPSHLPLSITDQRWWFAVRLGLVQCTDQAQIRLSRLLPRCHCHCAAAVIIVNMSNDLDADATNDEELEPMMSRRQQRDSDDRQLVTGFSLASHWNCTWIRNRIEPVHSIE